MIGTLAFTSVMLTISLLSMWWLNGKLPDFIQSQREKIKTSEGRIVKFQIWNKTIAFRVNREFWVRLAFFVLGPAAVIGLSVAYAQILPLRVVFVLYVLPAHLIMLVLGIIYPEWGRRAAVGFAGGLLATIIYDVVRLLLVVALGLPDPIPHIGVLWGGQALADQWWVGYLWRLLGNGAGLGIAYAMLPRAWFNIKGGWIYGDFVGLGMFAVLFFFPVAQFHLFILNGTVAVNGILGHWAYGIAIGWLFRQTRLKDSFPSHKL